MHVFSRDSGLNILFEEIQSPPSAWPLAPRQVSIALTNVCDLDCPYCYAPKNRSALDTDQVKRWTEELDISGTMGIGFGGGEPTLYSGFADLCEHAAQSTRLAVTFTTHGLRLTPELARRLKGNIHFIRISMDGVGQTYERLRGRSFCRVLAGIRQAAEVAPFGINYVVTDETVSDLDEASRLSAELGAREFLLLPEQPTKRRNGVDDLTTQRVRDWISDYRGPMRLAISERGSDHVLFDNPFKLESGIRAYAHIDAAGRLKRNSYEADGIPIGDDGIISALNRLHQL